ncbi:hypothetical protein [Antiquaquibacter soli]|uniref:Gram-positive cocci surface proteins LPxTG domain-containing protein n=1 Tax=Antiquaquibacter soli TaxID=3064523 RepID=A0ABT9BRR2_9MICO|nr:hypothetical protein [Protaetiibacter sp. WY-16]MDO7883697.1 hypothetical protein [Protaetiibacter sp. WY-16]
MHRPALLSAAAVAVALAVVPVAPALAASGILVVTGTTVGITDETSATFHYEFIDSTDTGDDVTCSLDGGPWQACPDGYTVTGLSDGDHTMLFASPTTNGATAVWTVDDAGPVVQIEPLPQYINAVPNVEFTVTDRTGIRRIWCEDLQTGSSGPYWSSGDCDSPSIVNTGLDGPHTYTVTATDTWWQEGGDSITYFLDRVLPEVSITSDPGTESGAEAQFEFEGADVDSEGTIVPPYQSGIDRFECALDDAERAECVSPLVLDGLTDGEHTVTVWAIDRAGNETADERTWTADASAPVISIDEVEPFLTHAPASISWTVDDPTATLECEYAFENADEAVNTSGACAASPQVLSDVEGRYSFTVDARDAVGNTASLSRSFVVDRTSPVVSLTATPPAVSGSASGSLSFTAGEGRHDPWVSGVARFVCVLDGTIVDPCASPFEFSGLGDGEHEFGVIAVDNAGNTSDSVGHDWLVDTVPPTVEIESAPAEFTNEASASIVFTVVDTGSGIQSQSCSADGDSVPCSSPISLSGLAEGEHEVVISVTDNAGLTASATATWTVDTVAPVVEFTRAPLTSGASATFEFRSTDASPVGLPIAVAAAPLAMFECSLDGGAFDECASPLELTGLAAGGHELSVRATDAAGNSGEAAVHEWVVQLPAAAPADPRPLASTGSGIPVGGIVAAGVLTVLGGVLLARRTRRA